MRTRIRRLVDGLPLASLMLLAACGSKTPGARPHDMSAAQHEAMASREAQKAEIHAAQFDPGASARTYQCSRGRSPTYETACWSSVTNPTKEHLEQANKHRKMAADHRAASTMLQEAEARACVGLPDDDRDESPFAHREDIASVEPLTTTTTPAKGAYPRTEGALITFRAVPGITASWLQRVVDCHLARNAALGYEVPEMPYCPLVLKGVAAKTSTTTAGISVAVRSSDPQTAEEVLRRARALVAR